VDALVEVYLRSPEDPSLTVSLTPTIAMQRLFQILAALVGIWLFGSFAGVMFDPMRAQLWTQSLMWALLASVTLAPVFLFVGTSDPSSSQSASPKQAEPSFETDNTVEVQQKEAESTDEPTEEQGWPYTSN
jgi:hypothetical protein